MRNDVQRLLALARVLGILMPNADVGLTGEPSLSLPCYAERRYGGVPDEEMLMALSPAHLAKAITGMKALAKNGLRYPIPPYGIQSDVRAGMGVSYARK